MLLGSAEREESRPYAPFFMLQQAVDFRKNAERDESRPYGFLVQKCQFFISKIALKSSLEKFQYRKNR